MGNLVFDFATIIGRTARGWALFVFVQAFFLLLVRRDAVVFICVASESFWGRFAPCTLCVGNP